MAKATDDSRGAPGPDPGSDQSKSSAATRLVEMALERYQFGISDDGQPYAVRPGQHVVRMLRGGKDSLRAELARAYYERYGKAAPQQALADAALVLEGMAQDRDPDRVHLRVAWADGAVWLDLGDTAETVVKIDPTGWRLVSAGVPVLFRRTALTGVMPEPAADGDLDLLWKYLNVSPADRPIVLAWQVAAIIDPEAPHPILSIFGEHGTGKTSAAKAIVALVDPSPAPVRQPPRDPEQWVTAAQGSWVVGLDNLSQVPNWFSDSLCRASTGDGDVRRRLYTDDQLAVFAFRRCVVLTGIDVGALRGDLADRIATSYLDRISDSARLSETELAEQWSRAYPSILGGLLSLAAETMRRLPSVHLTSSPRMADFARILAAVDQLLGTDGLGRFIEQAQVMAEDSLASDPFLARLHELEVDFIGRAAELLYKATPDEDGWRPSRDWPKGPRAVTSLLRRNAPALRRAGWVVEDDTDRDHIIIWTLRHPAKIGDEDPGSSQDSRAPGTAGIDPAASALFDPADVLPGTQKSCRECGDPLDGPPGLSRCKAKHRARDDSRS